MKPHLHRAGCGCLSVPARGLPRRGLLGIGLGAGLLATFPAQAAGGKSYEAMLVNCIDPRFTTSSFAYMAGRGFKDLYSQFVIAGGPIGVVADPFKDWRSTFWDNLDITVKLHSIKRVVGVVHRDCGAGAVAYGDRMLSDFAFETEKLTGALQAFRSELGKRFPKLSVDTGIMDLDGVVTVVS